MDMTELASRGIRVKPLEWEDGRAKTPFGDARIWTGHNVSYYNGYEFRAGDHFAAAKAAAQADYTAGILAALEATP